MGDLMIETNPIRAQLQQEKHTAFVQWQKSGYADLEAHSRFLAAFTRLMDLRHLR